jgi:hypothetical protein
VNEVANGAMKSSGTRGIVLQHRVVAGKASDVVVLYCMVTSQGPAPHEHEAANSPRNEWRGRRCSVNLPIAGGLGIASKGTKKQTGLVWKGLGGVDRACGIQL